MTSQQAFFLCKVYPDPTFNQLLMRMMKHPQLVDEPKICKVEMSTDLRMEFLAKLRTANIHRGSLFPDLNGFSRFLRMDWEIERDKFRIARQNAADPPQEDTDETTASYL